MTSTGPDQPEPPAQPFPQAPKTNTLAVVSLALSFFIGVIAIVTGFLALAQIRARGEAGRGLALAGIIIGSVATVFTALVVVLMVVFAATMGTVFVAALNGIPHGLPSSASPTPHAGSPNAPDASTEPSGKVGTADFDAGYLTVGTGPVTIDVYFDPMCPFCRQFEQTNGGSLALAATNDAITLRLHSMTFLDRLSQGTDYSTRASSALTCQATLNPELTLDYLAALFANQPAEDTEGLSDDELVALVPGGASISDCLTSGAYDAWSQANTEAAVTGPLDGAEIPAISGTPTVLVDGAVYRGSLTDPVEFAQFVTGAFTP
ncbi:DUF4190 domain-containing protein [Cryobacterium psychrophilum]|uniref:DUF4190 domain-containing protein n=1 Tax=Cryobacterium psychrophilum TaxID=41988 RepID=A0A4Y8KVL2_9MICO|nr:thioredoxin domain-containing protein [Cryobacterium psychrophilum]TDW28631.1 protein-disulfide isomerase [Cryobacterium psychrophilum]TFD80374.1 DUF4190 domain-containing protein [Cryobacterium psychrophilum]